MQLPFADKPKPNCGVFGVFGSPFASTLTYYGLHALQHRGQEGAGIVSLEYDSTRGRSHFNIHRGLLNILKASQLLDIIATQLRGRQTILSMFSRLL